MFKPKITIKQIELLKKKIEKLFTYINKYKKKMRIMNLINNNLFKFLVNN